MGGTFMSLDQEYTLYKNFNSQQREYTWGAAHQKKILKMLNSLQVIPISGGN